MDISPAELVIFLIIVLLTFGVARLSKLSAERGAVRAFRRPSSPVPAQPPPAPEPGESPRP